MIKVSTYVILLTGYQGPGDQREVESFIDIGVVCRVKDATAETEVKVLEGLYP